MPSKALCKQRLRKLAAFLAGPVARAEARTRRKKLEQGWFYGDTRSDGLPEKIGVEPNLCHTSACALGWASVVFPQHLKLQDGGVDGKGRYEGLSNYGLARRFFGLSMDAPDRLFGPEDATPKEKAAELRAAAREL